MLKIRTFPDPVLRQKAEPVETIDDSMRELADKMLEVMYQDEGVGLAATQVGITKRLIVLDSGEGPMICFNPEIIKKGDELETMEEGCLSLPEIRVNTNRPKSIRLKAIDEQGKPIEIQVEGLIARVVQHEIDHLNGVLIIDYASSIQLTMLKSKLKKMKK
jgi:peptide deformylase